MVTYTPEERDVRRRRSSGRRIIRPLIEEDEASWITDLRAQGVDVDDFLKAAFTPPEVIDVSDEQSNNLSDNSSERIQGRLPRRLSQGERLSIISRFSDHPDVNDEAKERFSQLLEIPYDIDKNTSDLVTKSLEEMSQERWHREVEEDSKNYDPSSTTEEKIQQNKEYALNMALQRAAEAGLKPAPESSSTSSAKSIYPKLDPPETQPLPPIDEDDFNISEPPLNPQELGFFPPSLPHQLIDLVPKATRARGRIVDGIVIHGTYEKAWESCDSNAMVVSCINAKCASFLHCSRGASLVRCESCNTVSPACPESSRWSRSTHDDLVEGRKSSMDISNTRNSLDSVGTNYAVRMTFG
eukprot:CAMPEP_0172329476 /NCGR_PEP_ID=MMETSP1058-20130122/60902_1 /TAXON_ID=83371 /ORGANISM="Detonula confervacea, Strain CCMP 353" /LENGTH=354 /DNA_ID=CAMNT_0013046653 /DNA_START=182 /DNA_END=1246 /DNA_ORIENTATION=-